MSKDKKSGSKLQISTKYNRNFSDAFRRQKVSDLESGLLTISALCAQYSISRTTVYKWIYRYSVHHQKGTKQVVQMESEAYKTAQLRARVAELERIIGQKQLALDFLEELVSIASEELGVDLKKNFAPLPSNDSVLNAPKDTP